VAKGSIPSASAITVGIVGVEQKKFTPDTEKRARDRIRAIISFPLVVAISSGHCHLGGVDIFVEEIAKELGKPTLIFPPLTQEWSSGYKPRNLQIVNASDVVICLTVKELPDGYDGMRFPLCYHCGTKDHVKSGGCWTVKQAIRRGKRGRVEVI
jgi:hypothetical protein